MIFLERFKAAHSRILADETTETRNGSSDPNSRMNSDRLYNKATSVLTDALELVKHFEDGNTKLAGQKVSGDLEGNWKDDIKQLEDILEIGRRVGKAKVDKVVSGIKKQSVDAHTDHISSLLYGEHETPGIAWAAVAQKHERTMKRLTRTLPRE